MLSLQMAITIESEVAIESKKNPNPELKVSTSVPHLGHING